jgi:hypothetical protein
LIVPSIITTGHRPSRPAVDHHDRPSIIPTRALDHHGRAVDHPALMALR